jgi:hypothetical protein
MSAAEFAAKAIDCAAFAAKPLGADTATRLKSTVNALETVQNISELRRILT